MKMMIVEIMIYFKGSKSKMLIVNSKIIPNFSIRIKDKRTKSNIYSIQSKKDQKLPLKNSSIFLWMRHQTLNMINL